MRWYESNSNQKAIESWNKKLKDQSKYEKVMTANSRHHLFCLFKLLEIGRGHTR